MLGHTQSYIVYLKLKQDIREWAVERHRIIHKNLAKPQFYKRYIVYLKAEESLFGNFTLMKT